jgi:phosphoribosylamine---glycine ligase
MNILVIGSGGREHALVWALSRSAGLKKLFCAPGNPGIARLAEIVPINSVDKQALLDFARTQQIDLTIVGPEQPLAEGIVDLFLENGLVIFGPTRRAAELEWSKAFAKEFMTRHGIPTGASRTFTRDETGEAIDYVRASSLPVVVKADGLAAGKGVVICQDHDAAVRAVQDMLQGTSFGDAGSCVVIEEFLQGEEASIFAITDGRDHILLAPAQDHKRALDGDEGQNTGGMGAYAPTPIITPRLLHQVEDEIVRPTLKGMAEDGRPYCGCLYVGLMITQAGPKVIEYNSRFGDPETQVVLPLFHGDLAQALLAAARGGIGSHRNMSWSSHSSGNAVCVVLASGGYPGPYTQGKVITGLEQVDHTKCIVPFHAGTRVDGDNLVTSGGRVLGITAMHPSGSIADTIRDAYLAVGKVHFEGMHFRHDIAHRALIYGIGTYLEGTQKQ